MVDARGRARAGATFANPALAAAVTPRRPGFRRHVPFAIGALAIAALVVAAARPQRTVAVPVERASIMLATDTSGSMQATDVKPSRLVAVQRAALAFSARVPKRVNVGVMQFGGRAAVLQSPTKDRDAVRAAVARLTPRGGTAMGDAIVTALRALKQSAGINGKRPPAALLLISDGASTRGVEPVAAAQQARRQKIPVYTVALGTAGRHDQGQAQGRLDRDPPRAARPRARCARSPARRAASSSPRPTPRASTRSTRSSAPSSGASGRSTRSARRSRAARCCCCSWAPAPPCASSAASSDVTRRPTDPCPT